MHQYVAEEITSEDGKYRALIVGDLWPSEPYDDGGSPILRIETGWYAERVEQVEEITSYRVHSQIIEAASRWARHEPETFERYLRIFHGVTKVETYDARRGGGDFIYVTFDPKDWRDEVGAPEGSIGMEEWRAYCEGDVYGVVVEKNVTWRPVDPEDGDDTMDTWIDVDSCWGYYGFGEYVQEAAREALAEAQS